MAVIRRGNRIDLTGEDASLFARATLPSMRSKQEPQKNKYNVKCKFHTVRLTRNGSLSGSSGTGEVGITVDGPFDKTNITDPELIKGCISMLREKVKKKGAIASLEIIEIVDSE